MKILSITAVSFLLVTFIVISVASAQTNAETSANGVEAVELPEAGILPDSKLFNLKLWWEDVQRFFTFSDVKKAELEAKLAMKRLAEAEKLIEKGKPELAEKHLLQFQNRLAAAYEKTKQANEKGKDVEALVEKLRSNLLKQQKVLAKMYDKVPASAQDGVLNAIIAVAGDLRFVVGGDEDTWLCENGQWVKHGEPVSPMPTSGCGNENVNTDTNTGVSDSNTNELVGGDEDEHGCKASAGYTWCEEKRKCLRTWEESCINVNALFDKKSTLLYTETISTSHFDGRGWSVKKIWKKVGDDSPVELATVGRVNEHPSYFFISPDYSALYISLESKVQKLDLETGALTDIYTADKSVSSMAFSPDGTHALIWDQKYADPNDRDYAVKKLNLETSQVTPLASSTPGMASPYFARAWRADDIIVVSEMLGGVSTLWNFNLNTNELRKVGDSISIADISISIVSPHGSYVTVTIGTTKDVCDDFSGGTAWSNYGLLDPVSGNMLMEMGDSEKAVHLIAFTQDESQLLYSTHSTWESKDDCGTTPAKQYFLFNTLNQTVTRLDNYPAELSVLDIRHVGAEVHMSGSYQENTAKHAIEIGDRTLVSSDNIISIVAQYFSD